MSQMLQEDLSAFSISSKGELNKYTGNNTTVQIPSGVTSIGNYAFYNCSKITSITIPDSVTSIDEYAFADCGNLTSIIIPDGVISIGDYAFDHCCSLTNLKIPNSVTSLGSFVFSECNNLTSVTIPESVISIGEWLFLCCHDDLVANVDEGSFAEQYCKENDISYSVLVNGEIKSPNESSMKENVNLFTIKNGVLTEFDQDGAGKGVEEVQIPDEVEKIGKNAFRFCKTIKSVIIPDSVVEIEASAFSYCSALQTVVLPETVKKIGSLAFAGCSSLTKIILPSQITVVETGCFSGCAALEYVEFPAILLVIESEAFSRCESLTKAMLPDSVETIGDAAFAYCSNLTTIKVPKALKECTGAFYECEKLVHYEGIEDNQQFAIINNALCTKDGATLVQCLPCVTGKYIVPDSVSYISDNAFCNLQAITEIILPDNCEFAANAFAECSGLADNTGFAIIKDILIKYTGDCTKVNIPDNVKYISQYAFYENDTVEEVIFPTQLREIGENAFEKCSALKKAELPYYLCKLGNQAFDGCCLLESVSVPGNVKEIPDYCFSGCSSLKEVAFHEGLEVICDNVFDGCEALAELRLPYGVKRIGSVSDSAALQRIFIPETVREIDQFALGIDGLEWHVQANSYAKRFAQQNEDSYGYGYTIIDTPAEEFNATETQPDPYISENGILTTYLGAGESVVTIPDGITAIGKGAFASSDITTIVIPEGVCSICADAFLNCTSLENVVFLGGSAKVEARAFRRCANLQRIIVLSSGVELEAGVFCEDEADRLLYMHQDLCVYCAEGHPLIQYAFSESIKYAIIDESMSSLSVAELLDALCAYDDKRIDTAAFNINGDVLVSVNSQATVGCDTLVVPHFVKTIGEGAFKGILSSKIVLPNSVESICKEAFMECGARTISIPESIKRIEEYAFAHSFVENISLPNIPSLAPYTFTKCHHLTNVVFPTTLIEIGEGAFDGCGSLKKLTLLPGLVEIGKEAFARCVNLQVVAIPDSVVSIGEDCFKEKDQTLVFVCNEDSYAYKYAQENLIATASNMQLVEEHLHTKESLKEKQTPISLPCCGETIVLTANYSVFYKTIMNYADLAEELFDGFVQNYTGLIIDMDPERAKKLVVDMEATLKRAIDELQKLGIYIYKPEAGLWGLNAGVHCVTTQLNAVLEWMHALMAKKVEDINREGNEILREGKSKITGLSYGIITSSHLMLAAHAVDEYLARKRQRQEAAHFIQTELKKMEERLDAQVASEYAEAMEEQVFPAMRASLQMFAEGMLKTHVTLLETFGILPEKMLDTYDIEKSNKLLDVELASSQQKIPTLLKALSYCPHNLNVYKKLIEAKADLTELKNIAAVVGLDQEFEACTQKVQMEIEQRKKEEALAEQRRIEQQRREQEEARKKAERENLQAQIAALESELASLKGLFTGKRKKELGDKIAELQAKLKML